jgi:hypothetical protein
MAIQECPLKYITIYMHWKKNGAQEIMLLFPTITHAQYVLGINSKGKGKAIPLQAWSGPEGSRKLRFPDFMTTAQDGVKVVSLTHRPPLPPGNTSGTHIC